jgi:general secretion pathway protein E
MQYEPQKELLRRIEDEFGISLSGKPFYKGKGCQECAKSGYSGRIGIYEVFPTSESIRSMIAQKNSSDAITKQAIEEGMMLMWKDGIEKVEAGMTTIEEVLRAVREN